MKVGYARVSTNDQNLDLQKDELQKANCDKIFEEKESGSKSNRPALDSALEYMRAGDILVVWKLDRLGRSLKDLVEIVNNLKDKKMHFQSIKEGFDTSSASGKLVFHMFAALAEFEREIIIERTKAGLKSARARGRKGGRPKKLTDEIVKKARIMYKDETLTAKDIYETLNISRASFFKAVQQ